MLMTPSRCVLCLFNAFESTKAGAGSVSRPFTTVLYIQPTKRWVLVDLHSSSAAPLDQPVSLSAACRAAQKEFGIKGFPHFLTDAPWDFPPLFLLFFFFIYFCFLASGRHLRLNVPVHADRLTV